MSFCRLVVAGFDGLVFILTAALAHAFLHAAFGAHFFIVVTEPPSHHLAHTIMYMYGSTGGAYHVQYSKYSDQNAFHALQRYR